jgi:hypothetical protein
MEATMRQVSICVLAIGLLAISGLFAVMSPALAEEETQATFLGVEKCKMCHKTAAQGEQHPIWLKSQHAKAYETLAGEKAKEFAKARGIENPQTATECLKCHVTAHGVDAKLLGPKYQITDGVGCESCHGAGGNYSKSKTMKAVTKREVKPASVGLTIPDEKTCVKCHNKESPSFTGFDFKKMVAKIAHPVPEERKAKYKSAAE